jgi:hypothetical protein
MAVWKNPYLKDILTPLLLVCSNPIHTALLPLPSFNLGVKEKVKRKTRKKVIVLRVPAVCLLGGHSIQS